MMLRRFAKWFASSGGVWQTAGLVGLVVVLEILHVVQDDHGFWLLYWLTVYSAVTQPVLAYANKQDTAQGDLILQEIQAVAARIEAKEDQEIAILSTNGRVSVVVEDEKR
jgi:hypothetical protein